MGERTLKEGTKVFFGAPAKPMPEATSSAISQVVAQVPGIVEAHLPQCFIEGDKEARQILVIVVPDRAMIPEIAATLTDKLKPVFGAGQFIDILPFESGALPDGIRQAGCQILAAQKKPWWKVWS